MVKYTSINDLMYEITTSIPEDDRKSIPQIENFIKMSTRDFIEKNIKINYQLLKVKVIPITNYLAEIPVNFKKIVQIAGCDNKSRSHHSMLRWRGEVLAEIERQSDGCVKIVTKCKCKKDCTCEINLTDKELDLGINSNTGTTIGHGGGYQFIKYHLGYVDENDDSCRSVLHRDFYLMNPSQSNLFGLKQHHIADCLNLRLAKLAGGKYEYKIVRPGYITTNIKEGILLLSYYGTEIDSDGLVMFPQLSVFTEAIKNHAVVAVYEHLTRIHGRGPKDYFALLRYANEKSSGSKEELRSELNSVPYDELVMSLLRAKYHSKFEKNYESTIQSNYPDKIKILEERALRY